MQAETPRHIYVLGPIGEPQKIGFSRNPKAREKNVATHNHAACPVSFSIEVDAKIAWRVERRVHHLLRDRHVRGEWFDVTPSDAEVAIKRAIDEIQNKADVKVRLSGSDLRSFRQPKNAADIDATVRAARAKRREMKLSQTEFAEKFGLVVQTYKQWERGSRKPDRAVNVLLATIVEFPEIVERVVKARGRIL